MKPECCFADVDCGKMPASLHEDIWTWSRTPDCCSAADDAALGPGPDPIIYMNLELYLIIQIMALNHIRSSPPLRYKYLVNTRYPDATGGLSVVG